MTQYEEPKRKTLGHWRSLEGRQAYEKSYAEAMKRLPTPSKTIDIPTDYGTVRVYEWEPEHTRSATPILLAPGYRSGVPMWERNLPDLITKHPVYAVDALGDSGMSMQTAIINSGADQAAWLDQVISYWALIGPFSGLIRREVLRSVKRGVESLAAQSV